MEGRADDLEGEGHRDGHRDERGDLQDHQAERRDLPLIADPDVLRHDGGLPDHGGRQACGHEQSRHGVLAHDHEHHHQEDAHDPDGVKPRVAERQDGDQVENHGPHHKAHDHDLENNLEHASEHDRRQDVGHEEGDHELPAPEDLQPIIVVLCHELHRLQGAEDRGEVEDERRESGRRQSDDARPHERVGRQVVHHAVRVHLGGQVGTDREHDDGAHEESPTETKPDQEARTEEERRPGDADEVLAETVGAHEADLGEPLDATRENHVDPEQDGEERQHARLHRLDLVRQDLDRLLGRDADGPVEWVRDDEQPNHGHGQNDTEKRRHEGEHRDLPEPEGGPGVVRLQREHVHRAEEVSQESGRTAGRPHRPHDHCLRRGHPAALRDLASREHGDEDVEDEHGHGIAFVHDAHLQGDVAVYETEHHGEELPRRECSPRDAFEQFSHLSFLPCRSRDCCVSFLSFRGPF